MAHFVVDVESDGPCPHLFSMVSFGAVLVDGVYETTFHGLCRPISEHWLEDALAVSGYSREETLEFPDPEVTMKAFADWIREVGDRRNFFWADNNGFDWQFINYYFHAFYGGNPFGFSSQNINSLAKGKRGDLFYSFKHLRRTKHDHNPVNDAKGNAEALAILLDGIKGNPIKRR